MPVVVSPCKFAQQFLEFSSSLPQNGLNLGSLRSWKSIGESKQKGIVDGDDKEMKSWWKNRKLFIMFDFETLGVECMDMVGRTSQIGKSNLLLQFE